MAVSGLRLKKPSLWLSQLQSFLSGNFQSGRISLSRGWTDNEAASQLRCFQVLRVTLMSLQKLQQTSEDFERNPFLFSP